MLCGPAGQLPTHALNTMSRALLGPLTIHAATQESNVMEFNSLRFLSGLTLTAPEVLTGTVTVQVQATRSGVDPWVTLQSSGVDVEVTAGKSVTISPISAARLRLVSSVAEGADRLFYTAGDEKIV